MNHYKAISVHKNLFSKVSISCKVRGNFGTQNYNAPKNHHNKWTAASTSHANTLFETWINADSSYTISKPSQ